MEGFGVGICKSVCSSCLRKANLAVNKCWSVVIPLSIQEEK